MSLAKVAHDGNLGTQTDNVKIRQVTEWFKEHVTLFSQPYVLDDDQIRAVIGTHKNTLVTARAGSGKTRVIVAKVAYLVAHGLANLEEIAIFMFNRAAATEVNQRIAAVEIDGKKLVAPGEKVTIASTFHKFALDVVIRSGENPQIISSKEQDNLISDLLQQTLSSLHLRLSFREQQEMRSIVGNFITRAGQYFPGYANVEKLAQTVRVYCRQYQYQPEYAKNIRFHQVSLEVYRGYLATLRAPKIDFNLLLAVATDLLKSRACSGFLQEQLSHLKYIMIDEYQDFSYLFFSLVQALRQVALTARLFCVGDDWQAINRFAGSDVNYFLNFGQFFPEDYTNIPLATNYRSDRRIVEQANRYMLNNYNYDAIPARAFSHKSGKISCLNPDKVHLDKSDLEEDCLGDGQIFLALSQASQGRYSSEKVPPGAIRLLKTTLQILRRHPREEILLLHRHNFTSFDSITLEIFYQALRQLTISSGIMSEADFAQKVRCMTMHKSKGLESDIVILLEFNQEIVHGSHPHATIFQLFGDTRAAEVADQHRLIYVALTRAKHRLYLLSTDREPLNSK